GEYRENTSGGDNGRTPYASIKDGASTSMIIGEKPAAAAPPESAPQPAPVTARPEAAAESKVPALKEANAPAQIYSYRNDQPAMTPPAVQGWGFGNNSGGLGFGGGGGGQGGLGLGGLGLGGLGQPASNATLQPGFAFGFSP